MNRNAAITKAMGGQQADLLLANALEELRLRGQLPPAPSQFMREAGQDPLGEIRDIIQAKIDRLQQERTSIIYKQY